MGTGQGPYVVGRNVLSSGGFVVQSGDSQFHVDPGPNSLRNAVQSGINIRATTAIAVSHSHINHANDLNVLIDAMTYSGFDKQGVLLAGNSVVNGEEDKPAPLFARYRDFLERFIVMQPGQKVGINDVEIRALKASHSDSSAIGFKFFTPQFTLAYSGDTKYFPELIDEYKNSNILILNVPHFKREDAKNNLCVEDAVKIIQEVNPRLAIIQHFGLSMIKEDTLYVIREIQKATKVQTVAARDGMIVNPLSYSAEQGQKTLKVS